MVTNKSKNPKWFKPIDKALGIEKPDYEYEKTSPMKEFLTELKEKLKDLL